MAMHVAIALITYNLLVHLAPVRPPWSRRPRRPSARRSAAATGAVRPGLPSPRGKASTSASTSSPGRHAPAATLAATCSGLVAPAMTEATAGRLSSHPNARSSTLCPWRRGQRVQRGHLGQPLVAQLSGGRASPKAARRVPSGGGSPARYLPLSSPLASGK